MNYRFHTAQGTFRTGKHFLAFIPIKKQHVLKYTELQSETRGVQGFGAKFGASAANIQKTMV